MALWVGFAVGLILSSDWTASIHHAKNEKEKEHIKMQNMDPMWKILMKDGWENRHHSLTTFIWVALKENVKQGKILLTITGASSNPDSLLEL